MRVRTGVLDEVLAMGFARLVDEHEPGRGYFLAPHLGGYVEQGFKPTTPSPGDDGFHEATVTAALQWWRARGAARGSVSPRPAALDGPA